MQKSQAFIIIFFCFSILFLAGCSEKKEIPSFNYQKGKVLLGNTTINVEIADTFLLRTNGLMNRKSLDEFNGMLFVFDDDSVRYFWMKNTFIPLDIIFINSTFNIVKIQQAVPCKKDPCISYSSIYPSKYVVEVNKDFTNRYNIIKGMKVELIY